MTNQVDYTANGTTAVFPFPFAIHDASECQVLINEVLQSGDYSIRGQGSIDGGAVVFDSAPVTGSVITIRNRGPLSVTALDAASGHLADKLVAGSGVVLTTVTAPGGVQQIVVSAEAFDGLDKSENLADLSDKAAARANLEVYSKGEVDSRDLSVTTAIEAKLAGLSGVTNVVAARTKLDVYSKGEVDTIVQSSVDNLSGVTDPAAARDKLVVYSKTEVNELVDDLSGVTDPAAARDKLVVYSKTEVNELVDDLSGVTDPAQARSNLGLDAVAYLNVAQDWTKPQRSQAVQVATVGGTVALDFAQYQNFDLTLSSAITFADPTVTPAMVGQKGTIGINPAGFAIAGMGTAWKRVGAIGRPDVITGVGRIDYHIRALGRIEYAYNDVEA